MPPKPPLAARARGARRPRAKKSAPPPAGAAGREAEEAAGSPENRPRHGPSQSLLGPHNTLRQLLAGSAAGPAAAATPPRRAAGALRARLSLSPASSASTPMSRLKHATAQLGILAAGGRLPVRFDDVEAELPPPKKRRPGRPRTQQGRRPPKIEAFPDDDDSFMDHAPPGPPGSALGARPGLSRRSSYNNRGKRGLSIGNGFVAKPHSEVSETDYYKHIDSSMSEPNRMRQLLAWCFRKTMENDKSGPGGASNEARTAEGVAKAIERELLEDIINGAISTSWYSMKDDRPAAQDHVPGRTIIRPNPLNEANKESIAIFSAKLKSLRAEKARLLAAYQASVKGLDDLLLDPGAAPEEALRAYLREHQSDRSVQESTLGEPVPKEVQLHVQKAKSSVELDLELNVDKLHNLLHRLRQSAGLVSKLHQNVLAPEFSDLVRKYAHRGEGKNEPSTRELLRGITKLDRARRLK
ncbi:hypothetical protein METBIDRAFT_45762 [Metschnikowia bicuspidata var. bicuspidata NRRL YB-4993]|uniref:Kinetochore protein mis13 n=1 Tax=Metschnikowia bicuspidata var. bicuspidata NRRL YB-4993 TaxID=869754 RepID=A0A1A0H713_9ASCO|nr:hypothetical protein METBIDRAFT_45762 [Metschnikowia bicuspidata var. bicuspidata NRRL YB-4993]OBA19688.1 hypothetical protein METBIDRAFT_45762 [Metschnikowia bicuspidata var. bicuspidata NRRL YB-4993]